MNPLTAERSIPIQNEVVKSAWCNFGSFKIPAAITMGVASRKENRVAASREKPFKRPAVIVIPERDTPGNKARI